jgi:hypothetical protein
VKKPLTDTSPEAEQVLREAYRRMPFERKWRQMGAIYHTGRVLHEAGVCMRIPGATRDQIQQAWLAAVPGAPDAFRYWRPTMATNDENLAVMQEVIAALERLNIPYALGGSWVSSLVGKMRFTHDADFSVEPFPGKEAALCSSFGEDYFVSVESVRDAVRRRASFNVLHPPSGFKVDIFVRKDRPFELSVMARRRPSPLAGTGQSVVCVTPEDIILLKLEWYRLGGESSEQQWKDVLGVLQVQAGRLDDAYLDHWAADLGVADLLARARRDAAA